MRTITPVIIMVWCTNINRSFLRKNYKNVFGTVIDTLLSRRVRRRWAMRSWGERASAEEEREGVHNCSSSMRSVERVSGERRKQEERVPEVAAVWALLHSGMRRRLQVHGRRKWSKEVPRPRPKATRLDTAPFGFLVSLVLLSNKAGCVTSL